MPKIPSVLHSTPVRSLTFLLVVLLAHPAAAIVTRHDCDEARYLELGAREYEVARIFVHPKWRDMGPHDVGLMQLKQPAQDVTPAVLYAGDDEVGQVVTFVGRGDTGTGLTGPRPTDGKKRGATNTVDSVDEDWIFFDFDEGDEATDLEGVSGPGDSGGPALLAKDGKLYTLGVSVFSDGREKGPGRYGVLEGYTRVSTHREWIESIVSGMSADGEIALGVAVPMAEFSFEVEPGKSTRMSGMQVAVVDVREGG